MTEEAVKLDSVAAYFKRRYEFEASESLQLAILVRELSEKIKLLEQQNG